MKMHLTNYAINKKASNFSANETTGHKRRITTVFNLLEERGVDTDLLWT
jgi:hypothetical protein